MKAPKLSLQLSPNETMVKKRLTSVFTSKSVTDGKALKDVAACSACCLNKPTWWHTSFEYKHHSRPAPRAKPQFPNLMQAPSDNPAKHHIAVMVVHRAHYSITCGQATSNSSRDAACIRA